MIARVFGCVLMGLTFASIIFLAIGAVYLNLFCQDSTQDNCPEL